MDRPEAIWWLFWWAIVQRKRTMPHREIWYLFSKLLIPHRYKDPKCAFRTDKNTHLSVIPTLINWHEKAKRLEGDQLCKPELLEMFFEQD